MGTEMGGPGLGEAVHTSAEGQALEWFLMALVGTCAVPWCGSLLCRGRENEHEHPSCLLDLARAFFSRSAVGLTQAPQLLSYWVPSLSHAFLPAAVINNDLNKDRCTQIGSVMANFISHLSFKPFAFRGGGWRESSDTTERRTERGRQECKDH